MGGFNGQARRDRGAAISFAPIVVNAEAVMAEPGIAWNHAIGPRRAPAHAPREGPSSRGMSRTRGRVISALWRETTVPRRFTPTDVLFPADRPEPPRCIIRCLLRNAR